MRVVLLVVLAGWTGAGSAGLLGPGVSVPAPVKVTLCEIKAVPGRFRGQLVEFTAVASHGFEDSMVESGDCRWGKQGDPGVWLEYGGTAKTDTVYCCGPTRGTRRPAPLQVDGVSVPLVDDDRFREFDRRLHSPVPQHTARRGSDLVRATMQGRIFARREEVNGREYWEGYGHMGCCMLFALTRVVAVDPSPVDPKGISLPSPPPPSPVRKQ